MCRQPLPQPLSPPSAKLMIIALEEYGYQSRRGIRVPKKWRPSYSGDVIFFKKVMKVLEMNEEGLRFARCQSDSDDAELVAETVEEGNLGIVDDEVQDFGIGNYSPAPGVETVCVFPKNAAKTVVAGQETELLIGMKNEGDQHVKVIAVHASVHLPFDHRMLVQNLSSVTFNNAPVPPSVQATFPYIFAVSKFLQAGTFDLVGTIVYEIDQLPYQNTFYNGTIEVTEAGGFVSVETVFLVSLGFALLAFAGLWVRGQIQNLSKKTKRAPKVETGTRNVDASMDEWLEVGNCLHSIKSRQDKEEEVDPCGLSGLIGSRVSQYAFRPARRNEFEPFRSGLTKESMWKRRNKVSAKQLLVMLENGNSWVPIPVTTPESGPSTALKMTVPSTTVKEKDLLRKGTDVQKPEKKSSPHLALEGKNDCNNEDTQEALHEQQSWRTFNATSSEF
ncbi:translocon-associated protein subunit alpha [Tanacetum coccineum]